MIVRTSKTDPIQTAKIRLNRGEVGITFCPGKKHFSAVGMGFWDRDLSLDLAEIKSEGWDHVLTLVETDEMTALGVRDLGSAVARLGINWIHFPIPDGGVPITGISRLRKQLSSYLQNNEKVLVHCRGGLGRAGTLAATMLFDSGEYSTEQAITKVREVRMGAIENSDQEEFIRSLVPVD